MERCLHSFLSDVELNLYQYNYFTKNWQICNQNKKNNHQVRFYILSSFLDILFFINITENKKILP